MEKYTFRQYNAVYITLARDEQNRLYDVLGEDAHIEHVGSTAIPGLGGKGILDFVVGVKSSEIEHTKQ